jgi:hypothetical protein
LEKELATNSGPGVVAKRPTMAPSAEMLHRSPGRYQPEWNVAALWTNSITRDHCSCVKSRPLVGGTAFLMTDRRGFDRRGHAREVHAVRYFIVRYGCHEAAPSNNAR